MAGEGRGLISRSENDYNTGWKPVLRRASLVFVLVSSRGMPIIYGWRENRILS